MLKEKAPGKSVEIRVPPYGAIQVIKGVNHRRGTPSTVIEIEPQLFLKLAKGDILWHELSDDLYFSQFSASGSHVDLAGELFPVEV